MFYFKTIEEAFMNLLFQTIAFISAFKNLHPFLLEVLPLKFKSIYDPVLKKNKKERKISRELFGI